MNPATPGPDRRLVVVGGGMVAHRLVEALLQRLDDRLAGAAGAPRDAPGWRVTVLAEEPRAPYDRVALTSYFSGRDPEELTLGDPGMWRRPGVRLHRGHRVTGLDRDARTVTTERGLVVGYDALVLATGSAPFVPPVAGSETRGCFVYRTVDDVAALRSHVDELRAGAHEPRDGRDGRPRRPEVTGVVVGGGLLGLEAAGALTAMGVRTHVVEFAPRLMPLQVDDGGGEALRRLVTGLGVRVHVGTAVSRVLGHRRGPRTGSVAAVALADGGRLDADVVVFAAGVRPRDELARAAGLPVGERGGVVVDETCRTEDPAVHAVGEVACLGGRTYGLVAPGYAMAEVVADRLLNGSATFPGADLSTKLKLLGVDVASFGDAFAAGEGALSVVYADPVAGVYKKLVLSDDARTLRGGILVGDASDYPSLRALLDRPLDGEAAAWLLPAAGESARGSTGALPDDAAVCSCNGVSAGEIRAAVRGEGGEPATDLPEVKARTRAGTSCGSCLPLVKKLMTAELEATGATVSRALCEHFDLSRAQLFDVVRVTGIRSFGELVARHGRGRGCDICKPVVASILAPNRSIRWPPVIFV